MGASKILIVEDEPNMVAGLRDNFEYEGFQVITALDGVEGLERALEGFSGPGRSRRDDAAHERTRRLQTAEGKAPVDSRSSC